MSVIAGGSWSLVDPIFCQPQEVIGSAGLEAATAWSLHLPCHMSGGSSPWRDPPFYLHRCQFASCSSLKAKQQLVPSNWVCIDPKLLAGILFDYFTLNTQVRTEMNLSSHSHHQKSPICTVCWEEEEEQTERTNEQISSPVASRGLLDMLVTDWESRFKTTVIETSSCNKRSIIADWFGCSTGLTPLPGDGCKHQHHGRTEET